MTLEFPLPPLPRAANQRKTWSPPAGSSLGLLLTETARTHAGVVVAIARDTHSARALEDELRIFADDLPVLHFPDWETLPYDLFGPHPEIVSQRISTLYRLPSVHRGVLVVPVATLMQRLAPRTHIAGSGLSIARGQHFDMADEQRRLEACGYRHVPQVNEPGDFAVRGALMDIFPMGTREPYRIELFDEDIDSIRSFDPETQRSLQQVDAVELLPAREFPLTDEATKAFRERLRERFPIDVRRCTIYQDMKAGVSPAGIEYYLPLFFERTETLFDYLSANTLFVVGEGALEAAEHFWKQTDERHEQRAHDIERPILPPAELYLPPQSLREQLNKVLRVDLDASDPRAAETSTHAVSELRGDHRHGPFTQKLREYLDGHRVQRVLITADSAGRREALLEQLAAAELKPEVVSGWSAFAESESHFAITIASLESGFALERPRIAVFTERELIGERARTERRRRVSERDPEAIVRDLSELAIGAPIVHVDHGVGRYLGLITLDVGDMPGEFLAIEYAKGDKLYVPVAQLSLVSRYSGAAPELAPLHSLGGDAWERAKRKAAEKVRDAAAELLAIHAQRASRPGVAFQIDRAMLGQFADGFPFEETPDQQTAIDAVLEDLASKQPMDRVVCGDVGFGKTEVALRAAFAAATAGKQVALLVPTTLLAQQHYDNFRDRLADFPVRVELLSRFRSKRDTSEALKKLAEGGLDVVIGTHKLLQADVKFKNLGLVIVDE